MIHLFRCEMKKVRILGIVILLTLFASAFVPASFFGETNYRPERMMYFYALMAIGLFLTTRKSKKEKEKGFDSEVARHSKLKERIGESRLKRITQLSITFAMLGLFGVIIASILGHEGWFWLTFGLMFVGVFSGVYFADPKFKITTSR